METPSTIAILLEVIQEIWTHALLGTGLALVGTGLGWSLGEQSSLWFVRVTGWWVRKIAYPLFSCQSWWKRAGIIFLNNASMMGVLVLAGRFRATGLMAVACIGVTLGIAFRRLDQHTTDELAATLDPESAKQPKVTIGVLLNLLEPPAIMLAIGLSIGWQSVPLTGSQVATAFLWLVLPLSLLAAGGEALWLGAKRNGNNASSSGDGADVTSTTKP